MLVLFLHHCRHLAVLLIFLSSALWAQKIDLVLIEKSKRTLQLLERGRIVKTYRVALGGNPVGPKRKRGDEKTPEGDYRIDGRYLQSDYHRALHLSYPNAADRAWARQHHIDPGDQILIHGLPNGQANIGAAHRLIDWTLGCIAVTNTEIEEIWTLVINGTRVLIKP